ncbi:MAG: sulfite exporter TauE/SafE family protein [Exilispira sp.]
MDLLMFPAYKLIILFFIIFFAGVVDSIAGGGGILTIPAYLFLGLPGHNVLGTNKFSSSIGTLFATFRFAKSNKIDWTIAIFSVIFALIGSTIGSRLVLLIPVNFIKILLLILIPIITILILISPKIKLRKNRADLVDNPSDKTEYYFEKKFEEKIETKNNINIEVNVKKEKNKIKQKYIFYLIACFASLIIGMYDGFFGPGTGTFFILVYTYFLGMDMTIASGNAKVVNLSSNIAALVTFLIYKKVLLPLGIICAFFSVSGNLVGSTMAIKKGSKVIRPAFILALLLLFSKVVYDLFKNG